MPAHAPLSPEALDAWRFSLALPGAQERARDETLLALANGVLGIRGNIEESPSPTQGAFIAGVWERSQIHYHERHHGFARATDTRVPVADATAILIHIDGVSVDPAHGESLAFEHALALHEGRSERTSRWRTALGQTLEVRAERIVSLAYPGLACIRWRLRSIDCSGTLQLESCVCVSRGAAAQGDDPRYGAGAGLAMRVSATAADAQVASIAERTVHSGIGVACVQRHRVHGAEFSDAYEDENSASQVYSAMLAPGTEVTLEKYIAYAWTKPQGAASDAQLREQAIAMLGDAFGAGFDALASEQAHAFAAYWENAAVEIEGDDAALRDEQALRFNLFHLFQSAARDGHGGIAAKGLTGEGYEGHVFWDSETFVLPVYAFTAPALMKPSLVWRYRSLERARAHARELNHVRGALYPWRTIAGDECSAHYPSGSAQYHINAAVAFAIRLYVEASGDRAFLLAMGAEVLFETARIWLQVGHFNARRDGAFCIECVTGPDEYTALVDNNYYTNRMAQEHLRYAAATAHALALDEPAAYAALAHKLGLDETEVAEWSRAAEAMLLPFDERLGIVAQDDTFLDKPVWDFAGTPRALYPLLIHHHPMTLYRHQVCKQADALLALVLAGQDVSAEVKRRSFDYYEPLTVHDSTLSASTFAVLAAEVGYAAKASRYFHETLRVDLDDLHANTGHGAHMAAMAGSWLALAWGFGGMRVSHDGAGSTLAFDPMLPAHWNGYRFTIVWQGKRLSLRIAATDASYALLDGDDICISHAGEALRLRAGAVATRPLRSLAALAAPFPQPFKAVIFDLDGVIADTAHLHQAAWMRLADEIGVAWDDGVGEKLKGVDRATSLDIVLGDAGKRYSAAQKRELSDRKNGYYRVAIETFSARDLLPGALDALHAARAAGLKTALASASRSAGELVSRLGIADCFDHVVDAATVARAKPDPEIFLRAAAALGVAPQACLGIEDAQAGIAAIKSAGMAALGIGDARVLHGADAVLPDLTRFDLKKFVVT
ncbi:MAG: beta-phosphoglucomutase [Rudaea sp.]